MPLTAFSSSREMELDVEQLLARLAAETDQVPPPKGVAIPEAWKAHISTDLECPSCFCYGAEVVRAAKSKADGQSVRQAFFRFTQNSTSAGHHPFCDFSGSVPAGHIPENLVQFSTAKDGVSRAVRELVCRGIGLKIFGQRDMRAMREWFFQQKVASQFIVTLDPKLPGWLESLQRYRSWHPSRVPEVVELTKDVLRIPGFDFKAAARDELTRRYQPILKATHEKRIFLGAARGRIEKLATDFHTKSVFDPTVLRQHYELTQDLAKFICTNHAPLSRLVKEHAQLASLKSPKYLMAFASLLLFISDWEFNTAVGRFARIATSSAAVDESLGNVIGLNPFHDFDAWAMLIALQELPPLDLPTMDVKAEMEAWINETKRSAGL